MARKKRIRLPDENNLVKDSDVDDYDNTEFSSGGTNEQKILDEINDNVKNWSSYYAQNLTNSRIEKYFTFVDNWTAAQRTELILHKKPILQMNKIYDAVNKVLAEQRQNTAELEVKSLNGEAPDDLVKLNQDFLRHICFNSKSRIAYQTAFSDQIVGGFGAFRVRADYETPDSIDQTIFIDPIKDSEKTIFDPFAQDPTRCDGDFCAVYVVMNKKDFERQYPGVPYPSSFPMFTQMGQFSWGLKDQITVIEYYKKERYQFKLHKLSDGRVVRDEEWKRIEATPDFSSQNDNPLIALFSQSIAKPTIIKTITKEDHKIVMFKAIYNQIIERKDFPGRHLPIILVPGGISTIDGLDRTISFVRFARDAQVFHNYLLVDMAFSLQTGRKERFIGTPAQISGFEEIWKNVANVQGMLPANPDPIMGNLPVPIAANEISASYMQLFQQSEMSIQNILGFYEANRGADSVEKSGVAIKEQQRTGNMSVGVFYDNLNRAIEQCGRVVMSMKKEIFDTERKIPTLTQNGKTEHILINQQIAGNLMNNDMTSGEFDVVIAAGPSAAVQKAQSLDILVQLCGLNPNVFPMIADYIGENLSLDSISGIVKRLKTLVPPDVIAAEEGKPPPPPQPNPQLMIAQQQMQLKERDQQLQMEKIQLEQKKIESQLQKLFQEIEITKIKAGAEVQKAAIDHNSKMVETTGKIIGSHNDMKKEVIKRV